MTNRVGRLAITFRAVAALIALAVIALAAGILAQSPPSVRSINELRRSSFTWNPAEIEFGFANWDRVFPGREVRRGARVRELPAGPPIVALSSGRAGGDELERFITEQKVAGLIVLSEGRVRLERYALGYSAAGRWTSQSVAKSMTSTLVGAAISDGFIASLDDPVTKYITGLKDSSYEGVTIRQLITMTSGVRWTESYTDPQSDIARFYSEPVTPGLDATVSYMRKLPREAPPGTKWVYKTGETHLLGVLVSSATHQPIADYLSAKIWAPYGMEQSAWWTLDRTNLEWAGCCLQAALRDYARFGQFVLEGARIDGRSIVPAGWLDAATRKQPGTAYGDRNYGYQWWLGTDGTFDAIGIHGQNIHIDPVRRLVVAINSAWPVATDQARSAARTRMLTAIAAALDAERTR